MMGILWYDVVFLCALNGLFNMCGGKHWTELLVNRDAVGAPDGSGSLFTTNNERALENRHLLVPTFFIILALLPLIPSTVLLVALVC